MDDVSTSYAGFGEERREQANPITCGHDQRQTHYSYAITAWSGAENIKPLIWQKEESLL